MKVRCGVWLILVVNDRLTDKETVYLPEGAICKRTYCLVQLSALFRTIFKCVTDLLAD